ncbi:MAG TPA: hypothetical protein VFP34_06060 [Microlunatus sp.]|nr:hypothetical protein [Microlunatus sp.]
MSNRLRPGVSPSKPAPPVRDDQWRRLREQFLAEYPSCPDCHSSWDLDDAGYELEDLDNGNRVITLTADWPAPARR